MLRLLPNPNAEKSDKGPKPSALVYTLLRHGRGLTSVEAERRLRQCLAAIRPAADSGPSSAA